MNEVGIGSLGGAIPGNLADRVAKEIIEHGEVRRSWIGVAAQPLLKKMAGEKGILVGGIVDGSPAEEAGIQAGDVITAFDGEEVHAFSSEDIPPFNGLVFATPIGSEVEIKGRRGRGEEKVWKVTTDTREGRVGQPKELRNWGITARDFTRISALEKRRPDKNGVLVESILAGGPAKEAKPDVRPGDVIVKLGEEAITSIASLRSATHELVDGKDEPQPVLVTYERGGQQLLTVVKVGPEEDRPKPRQSEKAWLGIDTQVLSPELAEGARPQGQERACASPASTTEPPAEEAGLEVGDVLLKLDGQVIKASRQEDSAVFANLIRQYDSDSEIELDLRRDGKKKTVVCAPPAEAGLCRSTRRIRRHGLRVHGPRNGIQGQGRAKTQRRRQGRHALEGRQLRLGGTGRSLQRGCRSFR